jgi:cytoskeletal protein RodZ
MRKLITASAVVLVVMLGAWFTLTMSAGARQPSVRPAMTQVRGAALQAQGSNEVGTSGETGSETATESTSASEAGSDEAGGTNETDGHEDPDGVDVNHECPPNCDTANGEVP